MLLLTRHPADSLRHSKDPQIRCYGSHFSDHMEMRASTNQVADYLDRHEGWFRRCAKPMDVEVLDPQAYALRLGRFGNFGFEVEPTIGLRLLPQQQGTYAITTVPIPGNNEGLNALYDVDFQASLHLEHQPGDDAIADGNPCTSVSWELDLSVWIKLPKVITMLPDGLVQSSGDHLLRQIVRQISRRLTWKVQEDFHATHGLTCPARKRAAF
ncbi:MAG: DUF1997 domain-containing protein [Synechococcus sp.]